MMYLSVFSGSYTRSVSNSTSMKLLVMMVLYSVCVFQSVFCKTVCTDDFHNCETDARCCCKPPRAVCQNHGKSLTFIPPLPNDITELSFKNNFLPKINRSTFANIEALNITSLKIETCKVENITADAFTSLRVLRVLSLDNNENLNAPQLGQALGSIQAHNGSKLTLSLGNVGLTEIKPGFFWHVKTSLLNLSIADNMLTSLDFTAFEDLSSLKVLSVGNNNLRTMKRGGGHTTLNTIVLNGNEIGRSVPSFCSSSHTENTFPLLDTLDLRNNFISQLTNDSWYCLKTLRTLKLSNNVVRQITRNTFSELTSLYELQLLHMAGNIKIEKYAFNNSNLKVLNLQENSITFKPKTSDGIFQGCGNLEKLVISYNNLDALDDDQLLRMFLPLERLGHLTAVSCRIKEFPFRLIYFLKHLNELILDQNRIDTIDTILHDIRNISYLSLQHNKITTLRKENFPTNPRSLKTNLNLALNPFACTCDLLWFRSTVTDTGMIQGFNLTNWPRMYSCSSPEALSRKHVTNYKPTVMECKHILLISVLCVASLAIIIVISVVLSYKYRWNIALWRYKIKRKRRKGEQQPLLAAETGRFRGYVIYDPHDEHFVHNDLRILVEDDMSYKLKLWERDVMPGGFKLEEMVDSIYASDTVLAVLSRSSLNNQWVRFQINVALDRQVELGRDLLILVLLEDLVYRKLPEYWCVMMTRLPTARWCCCENDVKRKVFEQQLQRQFDAARRDSIQ